MSKTGTLSRLIPVLVGFFIMGFCDIVGIATSYVKVDFNLNETMAGLIPSMVFVWFLLLSLPAALLMNKLGRKRMVIISDVITFVGMLLPFFAYNLTICLTAFILLGIGNTILQVSLNPLVNNIVKGKSLTSALTAGQVVKAVSSFCGPLLAAFVTLYIGEWQYLFPIYAILTLISALWLTFTQIPHEDKQEPTTIAQTLSLLGNSKIIMLFLGIFFIVGTDVGLNTVAPKLLIERCAFTVSDAGIGSSVYFFCRTAGAFIGAIILGHVSAIKYFRLNILAALLTMVALFYLNTTLTVMIALGLLGFFCSSIFSIIFAQALVAAPSKENELSGLMIMGVCGGAVIPPIMGYLTDLLHSQIGSLLAIGGCLIYLTYCSMALKTKKDI